MSDHGTAGGRRGGTLGPSDPARAVQSIVEVARAIFAARASSIMLYDDETRELEFTAVTGEGSAGCSAGDQRGHGDRRLGATSRQPVAIEDVGGDPRFARDVAESTGFVPKGLMAAPLLLDERILGCSRSSTARRRPVSR